jgi:hypothetical protein
MAKAGLIRRRGLRLRKSKNKKGTDIMRLSLSLMSVPIFLIALTSCGTPPRFGDEQGIPVQIQVELDRSVTKNMENRQARPSAGAGVGFSSGGATSTGVGVGLSFSSTTVYLVGGDNIGQGNVFRKELKWGANSFSVPLAAGRTIHLSVVVEGGRRGWEVVGSTVISGEKPYLSVVLNETQLSLSAAATPAIPASPAAAP